MSQVAVVCSCGHVMAWKPCPLFFSFINLQSLLLQKKGTGQQRSAQPRNSDKENQTLSRNYTIPMGYRELNLVFFFVFFLFFQALDCITKPRFLADRCFREGNTAQAA